MRNYSLPQQPCYLGVFMAVCKALFYIVKKGKRPVFVKVMSEPCR